MHFVKQTSRLCTLLTIIARLKHLPVLCVEIKVIVAFNDSSYTTAIMRRLYPFLQTAHTLRRH